MGLPNHSIHIRKILFNKLQLKYYLRLLNIGFRFLYSLRLLKRNDSYKYHYFNKQLIKEGFYVLDIGANLGYYTSLFSKWVGSTGKVFAVEPVPAFYDTLTWATQKCSNVQLFNCALGEEEKPVTLATPGQFGYLRTGLAHVVDSNPSEKTYEFSFRSEMKRASILFKDIPRIDFIKCDIEGYEEIVLPEMRDILMKFRPMIQLETWGEHRAKVEHFLWELGYRAFDIDRSSNKLKPIEETGNPTGDMLFIYQQNSIAANYKEHRA